MGVDQALLCDDRQTKEPASVFTLFQAKLEQVQLYIAAAMCHQPKRMLAPKLARFGPTYKCTHWRFGRHNTLIQYHPQSCSFGKTPP